jgi:hypothetical protein
VIFGAAGSIAATYEIGLKFILLRLKMTWIFLISIA